MPPIIDIHTHCSPPRPPGDRFGVVEALRGTPVGKNTVTNYRGLPAVSYHEMGDFELQQETCAKAGITGRIISTPFAAEVMAAISKSPSLDICKAVNDGIAGHRRPRARQLGHGHAQPVGPEPHRRGRTLPHVAEVQGPADLLELARPLHRRRGSFAFWEWAQDRQVPVFIHPPRVPIGNEQQMDQFKLDELIGRPFDTAMALARMILSGLFDRYPRLKIVVAHMGGGLLPCMGRLDFGYRLGCEGMPEDSVIRCKKMPSEYLKLLHVDTMGFWAPHVREAVEVFGADRVMFGTDYGPVPIDPKEHVDIVNELAISPADKENILWRNAARFFDLKVAP